MFKRILTISLAFIGLLVGAGFATGQETIQYFLSFGEVGLWGTVLAGIIMAAGGLVVLQLGSYFLAEDHSGVFRSVTHKAVAWFLDFSVTVTLFALGFVMLAGAGSTLNQEFGWPLWVGSTIMLMAVILTGLLDIDKVTGIIGYITPLLIVLVVIGFVYAMSQLPVDMAELDRLGKTQESPLSFWWLSAVNYAGLVMIMAVSMVLVMGGNYLDPREAGLGGFFGGIAYTVLLLMLAFTLFLVFDEVGGAAVPTLAMFNTIHPVLGSVAVWIIYLMVYNTAVGMFYALGRRLSSGRRDKFFLIYAAGALVGYAISFIGFEDLMAVVYPVLGYLGLVLTAVMVLAYLRAHKSITAEHERRVRIRSLLYRAEHPHEKYSPDDERELSELYAGSDANEDDVRSRAATDVAEDLCKDADIDYEVPEDLSDLENRGRGN